MTSYLLDGPLQKQNILMKLIHEMDRRPNFGTIFDNDPDGEIRLWMARTGALMDRCGIRHGVNFRTSIAMAATHWADSINVMLVSVRDVIEQLKLELELYQNDQIGSVYEPGQVFKFNQDVLAVVSNAETNVFVVDPYFDAATFGMLFSASSPVDVMVLCGQSHAAVSQIAEKYRSDTDYRAAVRRSKDIHDRLLIVDGKECWLLGTSIKDGGKKPTYLMPLPPDLALKKIEIYQQLWDSLAKPS